MKLHTLKPAKGSVKSRKRIGRGQGSGRGGTSTKGHKGAQSRSGYSKKLGFEGGQMPLQRRIPKFGFKSPFRVEYKPINLSDLEKLNKDHSVSDIDFSTFRDHGLCGKNDKIKILGRGELTAKINVSAHAFSESAKAAIEKAGGSVQIIENK